MRYLGLILCTAFVSGAVGAAQSAPSRSPKLPIGGTVTNPDWLAKPSGDDVAFFFPVAAAALGREGRALIKCKVDLTGALQDCKVQSEAPDGYGFGYAAMGLATIMRMKPMVLDGVPVAGAEVSVPISFRLKTVTTTTLLQGARP